MSMTMEQFKRWLEERISILGPELERLLNARKAIEMAEQEGFKLKVPTLSAEAGRASPAFPAKKRINRGPYKTPDHEGMARIRADIDRILNAGGSLSSGDIIRQMGFAGVDKNTKDRVYSELSRLRTVGKLRRSPDGLWSFAHQEDDEKRNGTDG